MWGFLVSASVYRGMLNITASCFFRSFITNFLIFEVDESLNENSQKQRFPPSNYTIPS